MAANCSVIPPDPDLGGLPIRISIGALSIMTALVPRTKATESLLRALRTNAGLNALGLLITAITQTSRKTITLYHAIVVLHMISFLAIATNFTRVYTLSVSSLRAFVSGALVWLASVLFSVFTYVVWISAPNFGIHSECNYQTRYVLMFATVPATAKWLRVFILTFAGIAILFLVVTPMLSGISWLLFVGHRNDSGGKDKDDSNPAAQRDQMLAIRVLAAVYGIANLELMVKRNNIGPEETRWGSGEILSLLLMISTVNEVTHHFIQQHAASRTEKEGGSFWKWAGNGVWNQAFAQLDHRV